MKLTKRQKEVLCLVTLPTEEIARRLNIAYSTARNLLFCACQRLGASGRTEALMIALQRGIISLNEVHWGDRQGKRHLALLIKSALETVQQENPRLSRLRAAAVRLHLEREV